MLNRCENSSYYPDLGMGARIVDGGQHRSSANKYQRRGHTEQRAGLRFDNALVGCGFGRRAAGVSTQAALVSEPDPTSSLSSSAVRERGLALALFFRSLRLARRNAGPCIEGSFAATMIGK